jgi:uncharacterized protein (TIGR00288 family)
MASPAAEQDTNRVALFVDCDNTRPEILEFALNMAAKFGRVVLRRGYGNHATLANKWQAALVRLAFTPCLQFQYAAGKNTADIALAIDATEALFDERADVFCLVTNDSDFSYLCRKLRERGSTVFIVGEAKAPSALRHASDQFFEWAMPEPFPSTVAAQPAEPLVPSAQATPPVAATGPVAKSCPPVVLEAVAMLAADTDDGRVLLSSLGEFLRRSDPSFSTKAYGHATLSNMVRLYPELRLSSEGLIHWVTLSPREEATH